MALSTIQKNLLSFFEQNWYLHSLIPSEEKALAHGFSASEYRSAVSDETFINSLARRGIDTRSLTSPQAKHGGSDGSGDGLDSAGQPTLPPGDSESGNTAKSDVTPSNSKPRGLLTPEQITAANVVLDFRDTRSQKKKLQELQISSSKWNGWLRQPEFQAYITQASEHLLTDNLYESHLALTDRVRSGDIGAIKYFNELTGRYTQAKNEKIDVASVLMRVLEIIQVHVQDPIILTNISRDFLVLAEANEVHRGMVPVTVENPKALSPVGVSSIPKPAVIEHGDF